LDVLLGQGVPALQLKHGSIGAEHILLGLIREGGGVAAQVRVRVGADLNQMRQQVLQLRRLQLLQAPPGIRLVGKSSILERGDQGSSGSVTFSATFGIDDSNGQDGGLSVKWPFAVRNDPERQGDDVQDQALGLPPSGSCL
jgi:hypothetical protein